MMVPLFFERGRNNVFGPSKRRTLGVVVIFLTVLLLQQGRRVNNNKKSFYYYYYYYSPRHINNNSNISNNHTVNDTIIPLDDNNIGSNNKTFVSPFENSNNNKINRSSIHSSSSSQNDLTTFRHSSHTQQHHHHADAGGARDEHGSSWGYLIHDPTHVQRHPLPFTLDLNDGQPPICATPWGLGEEQVTGAKGLQRIHVATDNDILRQMHEVNHNNNINSNNKMPRILCIIYTHSNRHDTLVQAIVETYAPHCDGFMAASNQTNRTIGAVNLPHAGPESYTQMWNKVRSIWSYVHDHYLDDYEYFHLGGDDMVRVQQQLLFDVYHHTNRTYTSSILLTSLTDVPTVKP